MSAVSSHPTSVKHQLFSQHTLLGSTTMDLKALIVVLAVAVAVWAEVPTGRQYLPPTAGGRLPPNQYGAPFPASNRYDHHHAFGANRLGGPSAQYGAPGGAYNRFGGPSAQYGAPNSGVNGLGAPGGAYNRLGALSGQYGAPISGVNGLGALSGQYGAPFHGANRFGAHSGYRGAAHPGANRFNGAYSGEFGGQGHLDGGYGGRYGNSGQADLAEPANYDVSYQVQDPPSGNDFGHQESRRGSEARGSYHVLLPDGRTQIVDYVANDAGYTPTIRYEGQAYNTLGGKGIAGPY